MVMINIVVIIIIIVVIIIIMQEKIAHVLAMFGINSVSKTRNPLFALAVKHVSNYSQKNKMDVKVNIVCALVYSFS